MTTRDTEWVQAYLSHVRHEKRLAERTLALYDEDLKKLLALAQHKSSLSLKAALQC